MRKLCFLLPALLIAVLGAGCSSKNQAGSTSKAAEWKKSEAPAGYINSMQTNMPGGPPATPTRPTNP